MAESDDDSDFSCSSSESYSNGNESGSDAVVQCDPAEISQLYREASRVLKRRRKSPPPLPNNRSDDDEMTSADDETLDASDAESTEGQRQFRSDLEQDIRAFMKAPHSPKNVPKLYRRMTETVFEPLRRFGVYTRQQYTIDMIQAMSNTWRVERVKASVVPKGIWLCSLCRSRKHLTARLIRVSDSAVMGYCGVDCAEAFDVMQRAMLLRRALFRSQVPLGSASTRPVSDVRVRALADRYIDLDRRVGDFLRRRHRIDEVGAIDK